MARDTKLGGVKILSARHRNIAVALAVKAKFISRLVVHLHADAALVKGGKDVLFGAPKLAKEQDRVEMARTNDVAR